MSDYARANTGGATHFGDKDALTSGDPDKVIVGSQFDSEFNALVTAVATKYDSDDIASLAEAQSETVNTKLITPLRLSNWSEANDAVIGDLHALSSQAADSVYGWDNSASAAIGWSIGTGLTTTVGGALEFSHLGIEELSDPGAFDRILFWDDTTTGVEWLQVTNGLEISGTQLGIADAAAGAGLTASTGTLAVGAGSGITVNADDVQLADAAPSTTKAIDVTSGAINIDLTSLTQIQGNALAATDEFYVQDGSVSKAMRYQDAGLIVNSAISTVKTFADADVNQVWQLSGVTDRAWDIDTGVGVAGNFFVFIQTGTGKIDFSGGTATINAADSATTTRTQNSVAVAICTAANTWYLYGDVI